ncbi:MAG: biotin/lipoyl-containing protein [Dehalococcoidia bacterium]|jgi:biotin carboxyl carrier protein|nr:biotin/lipoyl-containing protein [Dehalococcoidia bacterium]MDP6782570.1 biotin/lipoyl-containing protein [Dehalococcoidia bacterium]
MPQENVEVPITGKVLRVEVAVGNKVEEGAVLCIIESMKMENPILATVAGQVQEISVTPGQQVKSGQVLAVIEY